MLRKYSYFSHCECEFFPCHKCADLNNFNCLFCYCPLYVLGDKCGGNFVYLENGYKDRSRCFYQHNKENYDAIMKQYGEIMVATNNSSTTNGWSATLRVSGAFYGIFDDAGENINGRLGN